MPIITIEGPEIKDLDTRRALVRELTDASRPMGCRARR
jgi:phenylpyruvate tautomerase PptA (4-oxalocrotonate tautomerase family)